MPPGGTGTVAAPLPGTPHRRRPAAAGRRRLGPRGPGPPVPGAHAALHPAPLFAHGPRPRRPGDDQRQPQRRAPGARQRRGPGQISRPGRRLSHARPGHPGALRRLRGPPRGCRHRHSLAAGPGLGAGAHPPASFIRAHPGRRSRTEEHLLRGRPRRRPAQPAYRRPGPGGDLRLL